jgi:hypothetical protein
MIWFKPLPAKVAGFSNFVGSMFTIPWFNGYAVTLGTAPVEEEPLWSNIICIDTILLLVKAPRRAVRAGISVEEAGGVDAPKERTMGVPFTVA